MLQWRKKRGRHGIGGGTGERRTLIYSIKVLSSQIVNHWKVQHLHYIYTMSQGGCIWKIINQLYNISINILCIDHPNLWRKKNEMMNRRNAPSLLLSASIHSHSYRGWERIRVRVWLYDLFGGSGENGFGFYWPNWVSLDCYYY